MSSITIITSHQGGIWGRSQWGGSKTGGIPHPSLSPFPPLPLSIPLHPPLTPLSFPVPYPFPSPLSPTPCPPLPLNIPPFSRLGGLGERLSSPSGSGRSPAAKRFLMLFELKILHLWSFYLTCQRQAISEPAGRVKHGEVRGQRKASLLCVHTDENIGGRIYTVTLSGIIFEFSDKFAQLTSFQYVCAPKIEKLYCIKVGRELLTHPVLPIPRKLCCPLICLLARLRKNWSTEFHKIEHGTWNTETSY